VRAGRSQGLRTTPGRATEGNERNAARTADSGPQRGGDPNAKCSLSCGKWISITVDIDNNVKFGGKWEPYKKAFEGSPTWDLGKYFKSGIKDGRYVVVNLSADQSGNYGPFTGKAGVTAGMQVDPRTGKIDLPVAASAKLGFGYKKKVGIMGRQEEIGFT